MQDCKEVHTQVAHELAGWPAGLPFFSSSSTKIRACRRCRQLTVGAEHSGGEGAACAQQLPAHRAPNGAHILSQQRHKVACMQMMKGRPTGNRCAASR
jgi:hypothetical protein